MQIRNAFYRLAKNLSEEKRSDRVVEVLNKAEKTISLKLLPVDYQCILLASLYTPNGQKQIGEVRFKELAESLEEMLGYFVSFPSQERNSIAYEARYRLSLYNELIIQAAGTLSETDLKSMQNKLMWYTGQLG